MILLEFSSQEEDEEMDEDEKDEDEGTATITWAGTHNEYESIFKNNKTTIEKWLRNQGLI